MKNITKNKIFLITFCTLLGFSIPIFKDFQGKIDAKSPPNLNLGPEIHAMTNMSGLYITHDLFDYNIDMYSSNISYTYNSGSIYDVLWTLSFGTDTWQVNTNTREIIGSSSMYFNDFTHTPFWIFTNVSLSDEILISSIWDTDHIFEISNELVYNLTGFGLIEVWVLQDLAYSNCSAWYEKSTGILLNGTFYYNGGYNYLIFDFINTNAEFTYYSPSGDDAITSYNLLILIGIICIVSVILLRRRLKIIK